MQPVFGRIATLVITRHLDPLSRPPEPGLPAISPCRFGPASLWTTRLILRGYLRFYDLDRGAATDVTSATPSSVQQSMHQCELKTHRAAGPDTWVAALRTEHIGYTFSPFSGGAPSRPSSWSGASRLAPWLRPHPQRRRHAPKAPVMRLLAGYREFQGLGFTRPLEQVANKNRCPALVSFRRSRALD